MIKLYEHPLSPYAQKVKLAMYEKGIDFETQVPNLFAPEPEFSASSPRLEVPSLVDGPTVVFDSTIILEYLEDKWPEPTLLPAAPEERARVRMIEEVCDTYGEAINWALAEVRVFRRAKGALAEQLTQCAGRQIAGMSSWLERQLGERPYFNGDGFGWADLGVYPFVAGATVNGYAPKEGSPLAAWFARVSERDSVQRCAAAAAEALAGFQQLDALVESGVFKREYRDHRLEWMMRSGGQQIVLDGVQKGTIRFSVELE